MKQAAGTEPSPAALSGKESELELNRTGTCSSSSSGISSCGGVTRNRNGERYIGIYRMTEQEAHHTGDLVLHTLVKHGRCFPGYSRQMSRRPEPRFSLFIITAAK